MIPRAGNTCMRQVKRLTILGPRQRYITYLSDEGSSRTLDVLDDDGEIKRGLL